MARAAAARLGMSLRFFSSASPKAVADAGRVRHSLATFNELWDAATWLAQHRRFCSVGCVLIEYATKIVLTQLPTPEQEQCFRTLSQTTGVDLRDVDAATIVSTALTGTVPVPAAKTQSLFASLLFPPSQVDTAGLLRDVVRDVHALAVEHPRTFGDASRILGHLGEAAVQAYLSRSLGPAHPHAAAAAPAAAAKRVGC